METKPPSESSNSKKELTSEIKIKPSKGVKSAKEESFTDRWENSQFLAARIPYQVLNSIWVGVMAVGMFLAWLIALLAT